HSCGMVNGRLPATTAPPAPIRAESRLTARHCFEIKCRSNSDRSNFMKKCCSFALNMGKIRGQRRTATSRLFARLRSRVADRPLTKQRQANAFPVADGVLVG